MARLSRPPVLVLGLGNELMRDDGVGVHAVRALAAEKPHGVETLEIGTAILDALGPMERARAVIALDAVDAGYPPGTLLRVSPEDIGRAAAPASLHELDLPALLQMMPEGSRPPVIVLGVQPGTIAPGLELSREVQCALPHLLAEVRSTIGSMQRDLLAAADGRAVGARQGEDLPGGC
ncbi:MAG: hydrogenase maturation protease [Vicinamibacterales bacterium]